jgi:hypothetical protein
MAMPEEKFIPLDLVNTMLFRTVRPCVSTTKSHISHCASLSGEVVDLDPS